MLTRRHIRIKVMQALFSFYQGDQKKPKAALNALDESIQNNTSNLADAYKRNELDKGSKIGIFALSATIVDRAEPSEALKSNIVFHLGLKENKVLLSSLQLDAFRKGFDINEEADIKAEKGAYFVQSSFYLKGGQKEEWMFAADINKSSSDLIELKDNLSRNKNIIEDINEELGISTIMVEHDMKLVSSVSDRVMAMADGKMLLIGTPQEVQEDPEVLRAYLGD